MKFKNFLYFLLNSIANMNFIPRIFYMMFSFTFLGTVLYRFIVTPFIIVILGIFFLNLYIKDLLHRYILIRYFKVTLNKSFLESIDLLSLLIPISYILLNRNLEYSFFLPSIIWLDPLINKFNHLKTKLIINFLSSLIHLYFLILGIFLIAILQKYGIVDLLSVLKNSNIEKNMLSYVLFYFIMFNLTYLVMNILPISPFDMGVALENVGRLKLITAINKIGNVLILILYYTETITYITFPVYKFFTIRLINYLE